LKKAFLYLEAKKLKRFEKTIAHADLILAVNEHDTAYFKKQYPSVRTEYLPSFHSHSQVQIKSGKGQFILFHGNLSVAENSEAAEWLIKNVFAHITQNVIIAGLNPGDDLMKLIEKHEHIEVIPNPTEAKMTELMQEAHQHVLYTKQSTGLKLKLLNVLFAGRHIICNPSMLKGSGVVENESILLASTPQEFIEQIQKTTPIPFDNGLIHKRQEICQPFNNQINAKKLANFL